MTHRTRIALSLLLGLFCFTGLGCEKPAIQTAQPATASIATVPVKPVKALRKPWAHANSDLTPDPRITFGELDNGLRYILHPNPKPADRVYIRLVVETGSMNESDDQQGLAHFLEHMAFNGSKNFAPSEMVSHFQRLGMAFGRDINAYTSFDVTAYNIDLPNSTPKMLNEGMTLMRDYAGDLLVLQTEIDRERGVILSEMRDAMTPEYLDSKAIFNFVAPNTPLSTRWPLGKSETVSKMNRPLFKKYINDFYTADRMTLVVTGDIEPKAIAAEIDKHFGDLKNNTVPNAELTYRPGPAVKAAANVDAKLSMTEVSLMCLKPFDKTPDSVAAQIEGFRRRCALAMVNQRLSQTALDDKKILDLEASWYPFIGYCDLADLTAEGKAEDIDHLVKTLDTSIRQAITYGFTDQDITAAKARMLQNLEKLVEADPTRKSGP
ncbi:MAG: insulinase family protein, partial [Phycisphaerales bacterium]|nr:insulinase family protein [Phycisphaerales bacterium]